MAYGPCRVSESSDDSRSDERHGAEREGEVGVGGEDGRENASAKAREMAPHFVSDW